MNDELENAPSEEGSGEEGAVVTEDNVQVEDGAEAAEGLASDPGGEAGVDLDMIMDLPLEIVVELGRTKMLINDLLQIGQGSVIELNKAVGEPLDIMVNGKLVARGEVVVVKERFGVRITEILSTIERIKQLA